MQELLILEGIKFLKRLTGIILVVFLLQTGTVRAAIQTTSILSHVTLSGPINAGDSTSSTSLVGTGYGAVNESNGTWQPFFMSSDYRGRSSDKVTIIQADISNLDGSIINSATLQWVIYSGEGNIGQTKVSTFATNGVIGGNGNSINSIPGGAIQSSEFDTHGWASNGGYNQIDITDMLQQRVDSNADWLGLYIEPIDETSQYTMLGNDADRAQLVLTIDYNAGSVFHNPEPTTAIVWGVLICSAIMRTSRYRSLSCI